MKKVTLLIPCHNEEDCLRLLYSKLEDVVSAATDYHWDYLFVNDGSTDNSLGIIKELTSKRKNIGYIDLSRNFGKESALLAGLDFARGDCVIIIDADLQDPPELILEMVKLWEEGYDDIFARRTDRGKESFFRKRLTILYYRLLQKSVDMEMLPNVGDFRLLDRKCVTALCNIRESERYTKGLYCWIGYRKKEITFERGSRMRGESHYRYKDLFNLAINGLTSFTITPLRFSTILGFCISLVSFAYMIYILIKTLTYGDAVTGFPTLITVILLLGGIQLITIGIIGEYIGKIFMQTKNRPPYLIRENSYENKE